MKKFIALCLVFVCLLSFAGCDIANETTTHITTDQPGVQLSYVASFYDNYGEDWLNVEGSSFDIRPNKVKEYYYDDEGTWTWHYAMSSVMSVEIDNKDIETCGSTIVFADNALKRYEAEIPTDVTLSTDTTVDVSTPGNLRPEDWWNLKWWWKSSSQNNDNIGSRIVVIQSQLGNPICMYAGNQVSWEVSRNLPKTTEVCIDGHMIYIHRANFAIINTDMLEG